MTLHGTPCILECLRLMDALRHGRQLSCVVGIHASCCVHVVRVVGHLNTTVSESEPLLPSSTKNHSRGKPQNEHANLGQTRGFGRVGRVHGRIDQPQVLSLIVCKPADNVSTQCLLDVRAFNALFGL